MSRKFQTYIPIHGHSTYSLGDGISRIDDIVQTALKYSMPGISLTEHGNLCSFFKFWKLARQHNVNPIIGCEFYVNDLYFDDLEKFLEIKRNKNTNADADNRHIIALAKNTQGLHNLIRLSNRSYYNFYRKPLISTNMIFDYLDQNNIITTSCVNSLFSKLILTNQTTQFAQLVNQFKDKFGDNFYFEIELNSLKEQNIANQYYIKMSPIYHVPLVLGLDYHYTEKDDWYIQYLLYLIKNRQTVKTMPIDAWFYSVRNLYIKSIDEIYDEAQQLNIDESIINDAIQATFDINSQIDIQVPLYSQHYPKFSASEEESNALFQKKVQENWNKLVEAQIIPRDQISIYQQRLDYEMEVITNKKLIDYFLILDDILNNFVYQAGGMTGAGRGSAGGSLVLFVLGITKTDPIKYGLFFERFLNVARTDPPDVDVDIDSETQKRVETYLKSKFSEDNVCHIANFQKFGLKTTIKDLCRIFELDYTLSNELTKYFSDIKTDMSVELDNVQRAIGKVNPDLNDFIEKYRSIFVKYGSRLIGTVRQIGKHASGVLVSDTKLIDAFLPIIKAENEILTGVQEGGDEREVSELGYCKLDILGLQTVSIINDTIRKVEAQYNIANLEQKIFNSKFDDERVYAEFIKGNSIDIFQFGSEGMINLIKAAKPQTIIDLCAINALYRPAVLEANGVNDYLEAQRNIAATKQNVVQIHEKLWEILGPTYSVPVFQEQIMQILQEIGGFTLAEADKSRKVLKLLHKSNQTKNANFLAMLEKFRNGAKKNGISEKGIQQLLDKLEKYSHYSFNKSHALAYSMNAYISMWLKLYYPLEYYSALFNYAAFDDINQFAKQALNSGIQFHPFRLGYVRQYYDVDYDTHKLYIGLARVKSIDRTACQKFVDFKGSINDIATLKKFLTANKISKRTIVPLCKLGFFDDIYPNRQHLQDILLEDDVSNDAMFFEQGRNNMASNAAEYSLFQKLKFEREYLGFYVTQHPFEKYEAIIAQVYNDLNINCLLPKTVSKTQLIVGHNYIVCGIISDIMILKTRKTNREYWKIVLEDNQEQLLVTVWNATSVLNLPKGSLAFLRTTYSQWGFTAVPAPNFQIYIHKEV